MKLSSTFADNTSLPVRFTCDGANISPPLTFSGVPKNAKSIALVMDDPDAPMGTWDHWIVWNLPVTAKIEEGKEPDAPHGRNSFGKLHYGSPCPPSGTHRYIFKAYALDSVLALAPGSTKHLLETAMKGHVLAEAKLVGLYKRVKSN